MKTIAIMNLKGGTGKTATATNMAYILAQHHNERVLVVDADGQRNATTTLVDEVNLTHMGLSDYLLRQAPEAWRLYITESKYRGIDVLPGDTGLWAPDLSAKVSPTSLRDMRDDIMESDLYDTIIIDCPPQFPASAVNAILAASVVIIPTTLDGYATSGADELVEQIDQLRRVAPEVRVGGVLITMPYKSQAAHAREAALRRDGRLKVYDTVISKSSRVPESTYLHCPVAASDPRSWATIKYKQFVAEFLRREEAYRRG